MVKEISNKDGLSVKEMHSLLTKIIEDGHGDLKMTIAPNGKYVSNIVKAQVMGGSSTAVHLTND